MLPESFRDSPSAHPVHMGAWISPHCVPKLIPLLPVRRSVDRWRVNRLNESQQAFACSL